MAKKIKLPLKKKIALLTLGIFLALIVLEITLRLGGFIFLSWQEKKNQRSLGKRDAYRIMCIGESTTANQYPSFLQEYLNQQNMGIKFSIIDKGVPGANTSFILSQLESNLNKYKPDMVVAMTGINDGGKHMPINNLANSNNSFNTFLSSSKIYKLTKLIWLHTKAITNNNNINKLKKNNLKRNIFKYKNDNKFKNSLEKTIDKNPTYYWPYIELGALYRKQGKFEKAVKLFNKAKEVEPRDAEPYYELGITYLKQGKIGQAEKEFKKALKLNSKIISMKKKYFLKEKEMSSVSKKPNKKKNLFQKDIKLDSMNKNNLYFEYLKSGILYKNQNKFDKAEKYIKKAIQLKPNNDWAYIELGKNYWEQSDFFHGEKYFEKAIKLNCKNNDLYTELGLIYLFSGKLPQAKEALKKAIKIDPDNIQAYGALCLLSITSNNSKLANKYCKRTNEIETNNYRANTVYNYRQLKRILDKQNIQLVAVQYPMRNVEPLKKILSGHKKNQIIFVDNEKIFKNALADSSYQEYFRDIFAGNFGHCTDKGNKLLAENIGKVILKKILRK